MIATKILIIALGAVIGGWVALQLIRLTFSKMRRGYFILLMLVGVLVGCCAGWELAERLPQIRR